MASFEAVLVMYEICIQGIGSDQWYESFYVCCVNDYELFQIAITECKRLLDTDQLGITDAPFGVVLVISEDDRLCKFWIRRVGSLLPHVE